MNKTMVRVLCAVLGVLMIASTVTIIISGLVVACGK